MQGFLIIGKISLYVFTSFNTSFDFIVINAIVDGFSVSSGSDKVFIS